MPTLTRITLYPIKSFDGVDVPEATVLASGALAYDRRWALVDSAWNYINGKSTPTIHAIRASFSVNLQQITVGDERETRTFSLPCEADSLARWLGDLLGCRCRLVENDVVGFPDDRDSPGPTLISTATLGAIAEWYPGLPEWEIRRRLRANLEIDATEPFWEDQLALRAENGPEFSVGAAVFRGWNVCARCVVPTRDSRTGVAISGFARQFAEKRRETLPAWSPAERFDHFYRASINTRLAPPYAGGTVRLGDAIELRD